MKKFLNIFVVLAVLITGIHFNYGLFSSEPPSPIITVGNKMIASAQGSYCWRGLFNGKCVDMVSPPEIIRYADLKPTGVTSEAQLKIQFRYRPKENTLGANKWINEQDTEVVQLNDNVLTVPKEKGVYVYEIFARWEKGSSSYVFVIEVP